MKGFWGNILFSIVFLSPNRLLGSIIIPTISVFCFILCGFTSGLLSPKRGRLCPFFTTSHLSVHPVFTVPLWGRPPQVSISFVHRVGRAVATQAAVMWFFLGFGGFGPCFCLMLFYGFKVFYHVFFQCFSMVLRCFILVFANFWSYFWALLEGLLGLLFIFGGLLEQILVLRRQLLVMV